MKINRYIAGLCLIFSTGVNAMTVNLLTDSGFNTPSQALVGWGTTLTDRWSVENASIVGTTGTVSPNDPDGMLQLNKIGDTVTQSLQYVDISGFSNVSSATVSGWFNSEETGAKIRLSAVAKTATGLTAPPLDSIGTTLVLDSDPNTWEFVTTTLIIPVGTIIMESQFSFFNSTITSRGFVDTTSLTLTLVPLPVPLLLFTSGLLGLLCVGRRKR